MTYESWSERVDAILWQKVGLGVDDVPDWAQWDAYEDGLTPAQGAALAIRSARES